MKNKHNWKPNKFIETKDGNSWVPNMNYPGIGNHSYIIASKQIIHYQKTIKKHATGYLLDCGCGDVPYYGIYKDLIKDSYCIDWEYSPQQQVHVDQFVNLNEKLNITQTFDTIILSDVLEHIAEPQQLLQELSKLLNKEGKIIIMVPFMYRLHEEPHDYYRYTEHALRHLLAKANFTVNEIESYGGIVDVIFDLLNKGFFNTRLRSKFLSGIYNQVSKINYFKKVNNARKYSFPMGYVLIAEKN
jgi:SAM-dependent methyltransferase